MAIDAEIRQRNEIKAIYNNIKTKDEFSQWKNKLNYCFRCHFSDAYKNIFTLTHFLDEQNPTFRARLHCIIHDVYEIPRCQTCNNEIDIHDVRPYMSTPQHCSKACSRHDPKVLEKAKITRDNWSAEFKELVTRCRVDTVKKLVEQNPNYWKERDAKSKATKKKHYGNENYMAFGSKEFKDRLEQLHGDRNYRNIEKMKQTMKAKSDEEKEESKRKRLETFNRHKREDLNFVKNAVARSKATRIKNNGLDYTGRAKCKRTLQAKYGVENAYQIQEVKDEIKKNNLEKYGVEYYSQTKECKEKVANTFLERFGATNYFGSEEGIAHLKASNLEKHGVEYNWQREDVKQHIRETNMKRYGTESAMQNPEIRKKSQQRYLFQGIHFDSLPELAIYVWLADNNVDFKYQPKVTFQYEYNGNIKIYQPDFQIEDNFYEFKGLQFFQDKDPSKQMINPYDHSQDGIYEAKHQCMLANRVTIITDATKYLEHLKTKFSDEEIRSFRKS